MGWVFFHLCKAQWFELLHPLQQSAKLSTPEVANTVNVLFEATGHRGPLKGACAVNRLTSSDASTGFIGVV